MKKLAIFIVVGLLAWCVFMSVAMADSYAYRDGYYYDSAGAKYSRSSYVANGCTYYSYSRVIDYVPPAPKYEVSAEVKYPPAAKYEDPFDASLGRAIETRAKADAEIEQLVIRTRSQVDKLRAVLGGRALVGGYVPHYSPHYPRDLGHHATAGTTQYSLRQSTTYREAYGNPIDLDAIVTQYLRGVNDQVSASRQVQDRAADLIDRAADRQTETARAIVAADGVTARLTAAESFIDRILSRLDPPRQNTTTTTTEITPAPQTPQEPRLSSGVPLLSKYCGACHGDASKAKAGLVLNGSPISPERVARAIIAVQRQKGVAPMPPDEAIPEADLPGVIVELVRLR